MRTLRICATRPGVPMTGSTRPVVTTICRRALRELRLPVGDVMIDELDEIDFGPFSRTALACDAEEFVERGVQVVNLGEGGAGLSGDLGVRIAFENLEAHRQAGQTGAELMCCVRGESALGLEHSLDPVAAQSNRPRDAVDLLDAGARLGALAVKSPSPQPGRCPAPVVRVAQRCDAPARRRGWRRRPTPNAARTASCAT